MTARRDGDRPYVGLRPYQRDEDTLFYGRDEESREITTLWQAAGLTVVYGASGVGKTSLLNAGVLPLLDPERTDPLPIARVLPQMPIPSGNPYVMALLSAWAPGSDPNALAGVSITRFLERRQERTDLYGDPLPILAAIDQAEEIFHGALAREDHRKEFLEQLEQAAHDHTTLHLLLSLREEYLYLVLPYERPFGQGSRTRFHLQPFTREAALEVVTKPLLHTSRTITTAAAELLVDELRATTIADELGNAAVVELDSIEPVQLQVVCAALWESLPADVSEIDEEHVHAYAEIEEFLFDFCTQAVTEVAGELKLSVGEILLWLRRTFITEHGTRNTAYEGLAQIRGMPNSVAAALEDRHILHGEHRRGIKWYELAHDRLIGPVSRAESPGTYLQAARTAMAKRNWTTARRLANEALRAADGDESWVRAEVAEILANVAVADGDTETARQHCDEAAGLYAERGRFDGVARVLTLEGGLWMAQGDYAKAIDRISTAVSLAPNDMAAQMALAEAFRRAGTPQAAVAVVSAVLDSLPAEMREQAEKILRPPE